MITSFFSCYEQQVNGVEWQNSNSKEENTTGEKQTLTLHIFPPQEIKSTCLNTKKGKNDIAVHSVAQISLCKATPYELTDCAMEVISESNIHSVAAINPPLHFHVNLCIPVTLRYLMSVEWKRAREKNYEVKGSLSVYHSMSYQAPGAHTQNRNSHLT